MKTLFTEQELDKLGLEYVGTALHFYKCKWPTYIDKYGMTRPCYGRSFSKEVGDKIFEGDFAELQDGTLRLKRAFVEERGDDGYYRVEDMHRISMKMFIDSIKD